MTHQSTLITSRQNPLCKMVRSLHSRKGSREHGLFLAEGDNSVSAALGAGWPLQGLLGTPQALEERHEWVEQARAAGAALYEMEAELLAYLSEAETSPGLIALAKLPAAQSLALLPKNLILLLDGVADAGNVGALIRSADAAGAGGVAVTQGGADPFSPKAVRASAGSLFNIPLLPSAASSNWIEAAAERRVPIVVAVAHAGENCFQYQWPRDCVLVLGHETRGISPELEAAAQGRVTIPVYGKAESLNVAAAGAVLLYAWRQAHGG